MYLATDEFADLTSASLKKQIDKTLDEFRIYKPGDYITGTVIAKTPDSILVDIGSRAEGIIVGRELKTRTIKVKKLKKGDKILVYVISGEGSDGSIVLSLRKAEVIQVWLDVEKAYKDQKVVTVKVVEVNTGGVICELDNGLRGFIPVSQLDPRRIFGEAGHAVGKNIQTEVHKRLSELLGETIEVRIYEVDREKGKIIFSEKAMMLGENVSSRAELLQKIKPGDILEGVITGITPFGVFVNTQGLEGLVHLSELSWDKVTDVSTLFKVGQKVKVMVLSIDDAGRRVAYSIKRLTKDPWREKIKKYKVGSIVDGVVDGLVEYGAFIRIDDGINGLIHISEISEGRINHPKEVLKPGQEVKVLILGISSTARHLSLSLKRVDQSTGEVKEGAMIPIKAKKSKRLVPEIEVEDDVDEVDQVNEADKPKKVEKSEVEAEKSDETEKVEKSEEKPEKKAEKKSKEKAEKKAKSAKVTKSKKSAKSTKSKDKEESADDVDDAESTSTEDTKKSTTKKE